MTSTDLHDLKSSLDRAVAVLPVAAIEQHGPHLPLGTDSFIADGMVSLAIQRLDEQAPVTFLPTLRIGTSAEHSGFAGTLSHDGATATAGLLQVAAGLAAAGFRRIVVISAHGGNTPMVETAALELRRREGLFVPTASWLRFGYPDNLLPPSEITSGIHGGAVETSLMLYLRPDLVRADQIDDFPSLQDELAVSAKHLRAHGRIGFAWLAGDLNPAGVVGNARLASAEIGEAIADHQVAGFCAFIDDVLAFDLSRLA